MGVTLFETGFGKLPVDIVCVAHHFEGVADIDDATRLETQETPHHRRRGITGVASHSRVVVTHIDQDQLETSHSRDSPHRARHSTGCKRNSRPEELLDCCFVIGTRRSIYEIDLHVKYKTDSTSSHSDSGWPIVAPPFSM